MGRNCSGSQVCGSEEKQQHPMSGHRRRPRGSAQGFGSSSFLITSTTLPLLSTRTRSPFLTDNKVGDTLKARSLAALVARAEDPRSTFEVKAAFRGAFLALSADLPFDLFVPSMPKIRHALCDRKLSWPVLRRHRHQGRTPHRQKRQTLRQLQRGRPARKPRPRGCWADFFPVSLFSR
jgi:hypothetical protein